MLKHLLFYQRLLVYKFIDLFFHVHIVADRDLAVAEIYFELATFIVMLEAVFYFASLLAV